MIPMPASPNSRHRTAIALVVEDEPLQRMDMCDLVEEAGFEAVLARDADHAIAILTERLDITIVFTDIDMPGSMNGLKLAAAIRERWPPIEIIITTAGLAPDLRSLPARAIFLPKPLVPDDAIRTLQSLVA